MQLIRSAVLRGYFDVARQLGLNTQPLLRSVGLVSSALSDPEHLIPIADAIRLLELSAQVSNCMTYGLRMAELRQLSHLGAISLLLTQQRTLRNALMATIRYRHLLNESLALQIEDAGRKVILREDIVAPLPSRQSIELSVGVLMRTCSALQENRWRPQSVHFTHSAPDDFQVHRRLFRCSVEFDSTFNGLVCDAVTLDAPNPQADPAMASYAEQFLHTLDVRQEDSLVLNVRRAIYLLLPDGRATIEQVAQGMGLGVRNLQLHLDQAGTKFSIQLNTIRRELVSRYIDNHHYTIQQIGELLGYNMASSFSRWFQQEFAMSPRQWRKSGDRQ